MFELTLEITQQCPFAKQCDYCSTNATIDGKHLPKEEIVKYLDEQENIEIINISGGEPLMHPNIGEIILYSLSKTPNVCVFTNLMRWIRFNAYIIKEVKVEANVLPIQGRKVYFPQFVDKCHTLKLIHQGRAKHLPKQNITVSRNFCGDMDCDECNHTLLQADGKVVRGPCRKQYEETPC